MQNSDFVEVAVNQTRAGDTILTSMHSSSRSCFALGDIGTLTDRTMSESKSHMGLVPCSSVKQH